MMGAYSRVANTIVSAVVLAALLLLPLTDLTTIDLLVVLATTAALSVGWNWTAGLAGLLNLAHLAYYAVGAYSCAIAVVVYGYHPVVGMLAGAIVSGLLALAVSLLSFRLRVSEMYFALLTLTMAEGFSALSRGLENKYALGGFNLPLVNDPARFAFFDKEPYYYMLVGLTIVLVGVQHLVQRSGWGLMLAAARENQPAAASLGVPVTRVVTGVAVASAASASLVGSIIALASLFVTADNVFTVEMLLTVIIATVVGGIGTLWGPVIGAFFVIALKEVIHGQLSSTAAIGTTDVIFGIVLVIVIMIAPGGIVGLVKSWVKNRSRQVGKFA